MFAKRKQYVPGSFLPTPARVLAIIHLCLAFTLVFWYLSQPFMGEMHALKSLQIAYEDVMGTRTFSGQEKATERQTRQAKRFQNLDTKEKKQIIEAHKHLQDMLKQTFWSKLKRSFHILALEVPPFEQAWMLFSIIIPILLLKQRSGARQVIWLLPLLTLLYAVDNRLNGQKVDPDYFPSEKLIVENYLRHPLSQNIFEQREQLLLGWKTYLIEEWASENPKKDSVSFEQQAEKGEFSFTLAKLQQNPQYHAYFNYKQSLFILIIYLFWNVYFACYMRRFT